MSTEGAKGPVGANLVFAQFAQCSPDVLVLGVVMELFWRFVEWVCHAQVGSEVAVNDVDGLFYLAGRQLARAWIARHRPGYDNVANCLAWVGEAVRRIRVEL
ncbi:MAG: hypothetical protein ACPLRM_00275 [Anaerolineae bacterium]